MKRRQQFLIGTLAALLGTAVAGASEIYRYVDDAGEVHYVDRPTGAPTEERMAISSSPTDPATVQARVASRYDQARGPEDGAGADDEETLTRAERRARQKEREEKCEKYRGQLETYLTARRLFRETDSGEREYLDEDERLEARNRLEELVSETCD
jgi:hypothetical protein